MAKKKNTFGKLLAFTTTVAAIGGTCYIFRDKIKQSSIYKSVAGRLSGMKNDSSDDFFFDAEDDFKEDANDKSIFHDKSNNREYTSITMNAKEDTSPEKTISDDEAADSQTRESNITTNDTDNSGNIFSDSPIESNSDHITSMDTESAAASDNTTSTDSDSTSTLDSASTNASDSDSASTLDSDNTSASDSDSASTLDSDNASVLDSDNISTLDSDSTSASDSDNITTLNEDEKKETSSDEEPIPTIHFNVFSSSEPETVSAYENENLSDDSDDPDVLAEQDKLDF